MPDPAYLFGPARSRRPCVMAQQHVVVSGHYYASLAGLQILEAGGNAIDAGVATGLAIDVLESQFVGFGGVAPIMVYLADRAQVQVINGVGPWPQAADIEHFHREFGGRIPDGLLHTVVPAAPANWIEALARWGTMRFADVAAAAIRFARDGFPAYPFFVEILADKQDEIRKFPTTSAIFLAGGRVPEVGEISSRQIWRGRCNTWRIKSNRRVAIGWPGSPRRMMRSIAATSPARSCGTGGEWRLAARTRSRGIPCARRTAVSHGFGEFEVYGCGPWSQGPMVLQALNILEGLDLRSMGHNSAAYIHAVTEALKLAAADREAYFGDPDFVRVPLAALLAKDYAAQRRGLIDPARAWPEMPPAGDVGGGAMPPWRPDPSAGSGAEQVGAKPATSFLCVTDRAGSIFAATPSDGTIGGPVVPGTGILPSMWGSRGYSGRDHPGGSAPVAALACRPIRRSPSSRGGW